MLLFLWTVRTAVFKCGSEVLGLVWQCQGAARAGSSKREGEPQVEYDTKAGESRDLTKKKQDVKQNIWFMIRARNSRQGQTQSSDHTASP